MSVEAGDTQNAQMLREKRIAELKALFEAGQLAVDESALASRLVDAHIQEPQTSEHSSSSASRS